MASAVIKASRIRHIQKLMHFFRAFSEDGHKQQGIPYVKIFIAIFLTVSYILDISAHMKINKQNIICACALKYPNYTPTRQNN